MKIPFNRPTLAGKEFDYIGQAISEGRLAGDGVFTERCQRYLADLLDAPAVLLTHSCTAALELAAILVGIGPGDEVIMPSFTFVSTANSVVLRGGVPVFVDIRSDTLNIDARLIEAAITPRTKGLVPVHYAGVPADMDEINAIAAAHDLWVIEDAAQALGSTYKNRRAGTLGRLAALSFHETKNVISGEGGALIVNDPSLVGRAEIVREKGTNRKHFFRGQVDKYTWVDIGSSFLPGELVAAFLWGQLEQIATIERERLSTWLSYDQALRPFQVRGLRTPFVPEDRHHNGHLYYILMPDPARQRDLIARMGEDGIMTPFHYVPLHSSPGGRRFGRTSGELCQTDEASSRLVRLPLFPRMGDQFAAVLDRLTTHLDAIL